MALQYQSATTMGKPTEIDPLLPQNDTAPEISGYGSSRPKSNTNIVDSEPISDSPYEWQHASQQDQEEGDDTSGRAQVRRSIWGTIISVFTFVIFFGFIASLLSQQQGDLPPWRDQPSNPRPAPVHPVPGRPPPGHSIKERVKKILTGTPLIDGHNDLAIFVRALYKNDIYSQEFKDTFENGMPAGDVDLPRLRTGMVGGSFWSTFVVCPENASTDFSDAEYSTAVAHTLQQIDLVKRLQYQYASRFSPAGTPLDVMLDRFYSDRTMLGPLSIEGLHQVPQSAAMVTLRLYHELGVRAATLTWNCHNAFADAALITSANGTVYAPYHRGGLTPLGRNLVKEMNRLGMLVDISHTSYWTQKAVLSNKTSRAPVVFTHSSAYSLCPHPRNVKDDILELVKETDSLVMVNFSPNFISCTGNEKGDGIPDFYEKNSTLHQVARHVVYIGEKIGYDHVGIGSDFDGITGPKPRGLEGVDKYPDLIAELLRLGVSDGDAAKVVGENVLRVWRKAEEVATAMGSEGVVPGVDEVSGY